MQEFMGILLIVCFYSILVSTKTHHIPGSPVASGLLPGQIERRASGTCSEWSPSVRTLAIRYCKKIVRKDPQARSANVLLEKNCRGIH
jgi:hypothetical protein